jgi:hypothetical protein
MINTVKRKNMLVIILVFTICTVGIMKITVQSIKSMIEHLKKVNFGSQSMQKTLTLACCQTDFKLRSKPAENVSVSFSRSINEIL